MHHSLLAKLSFAVIIIFSNIQWANAQALGNAGANDVQKATGDTIQSVCGGLGRAGGFNLDDTTNQGKLFRVCNALVHTAINGDNFLNLSQVQLQETLQAIAPEEIAAIASGLTDTAHDQLSSVSSRIGFLRTGITKGSLAGISWTAEDMLGGAAGDGFSRLGFYVNGIYGTGSKDSTNEESGFDYDAYGFVSGIDYRFNDSIIGGLAIGYSESDVEFESNDDTTDSDGYSATLYSSFYQKNYYFDFMLSYSKHDYEGERHIYVPTNNSMTIPTAFNETAISDTKGDALSWSIAAGYTVDNNSWSSDYYAQLNGIDAKIDGYRETNSFLSMTVSDQDVESLQAVLGAKLSKTISNSKGILIPYVGLEWHFEFDDDKREVTAFYNFENNNEASNLLKFQSDDADNSFGMLTLGTSFVMPQGRQLFINYDRSVGLADVDINTLTFGVRFEL